MPRLLAAALVTLTALALAAPADEKLAGRACRPVHLAYRAPEGVAFYNEVTVARSAPGTYFCVCGFGKGYFGLQELANGKKLVIFSVWDPGKQDDPRQVGADRRVKLLHQGEGVRVGRFGGEGTGGQSFYDHAWEVGQTYRFLVRATPDGPDRTAYAGYFYDRPAQAWRHLVTFSTPAGGELLRGSYAFVEDFKRDGASAAQARKASYGNGWVKPRTGPWQPLARATFTADRNPATNIDAGPDGARLFLATGGETENATTKLGGTLQIAAPAAPPAELPEEG